MSFIMELPDNEGNRILAEALKMIAGEVESESIRLCLADALLQ